MSKEQLLGFLSEQYGLDYAVGDLDEIFGTSAENDMTFEDFAKVLPTLARRLATQPMSSVLPAGAVSTGDSMSTADN